MDRFVESEKLNLAAHFFAGATCVKQEQHIEMFAERIFIAVAVDNTGVFPALPTKTEKIVIVGHDDSILVQSESDVTGIVGTKQARVGRHGDINTMCAQANGDAWMNMFIQMEANRHGNRGPGESGRGVG